jgi:hypothetical protein
LAAQQSHGRLAARAQQPDRVRRIGVLSSLAADDAETQARHAAFLQGLQEKGWTSGRNVQIDYRWGAGDADRFRKYAAELVALTPDVILATGSPVTAALLQVTRTLPIVFANRRSHKKIRPTTADSVALNRRVRPQKQSLCWGLPRVRVAPRQGPRVRLASIQKTNLLPDIVRTRFSPWQARRTF